jgi:zinc-ribbon domain
MPYCPNCGSEIEADAAFCGSCGAHLGGEPPPPPSPPTRQGSSWAVLGGIVALIALVVGGVLLYNALTGDDEGQERRPGGEEEGVAAASPTVPAVLTPTEVAPSPTATALPEPTATRTPTLVPQPTLPPTPTVVPPPAGYATSEEALRAYIEQYGGRYAGDCALADIETDVGDFCATLQEDRGQTLIYAAGLTFSEYAVWLLVVNQGGGWLVVEEAEIALGPDGSAVPPW